MRSRFDGSFFETFKGVNISVGKQERYQKKNSSLSGEDNEIGYFFCSKVERNSSLHGE